MLETELLAKLSKAGLTLAVAERDPQRYGPNLCRLWARIAIDTPADAGQAGALAALQDSLGCEW